MSSQIAVVFGLVIIITAFCYARDEELAYVEDERDEARFTERPLSQDQGHYSDDTENLYNTHYLLVSTMDGKITALDVNSNGRVVWSADADMTPLLSGTLHSHQLTRNGNTLMLVPSLDGSLFMFNMESNALNPIPMNADVSDMIGEYAVAGGTVVSTTGVDPITGQVRYHCTAANCEQRAVTNHSPHILIIKRHTQIARAADRVTGSERWNLSVGEYMISLFSSDSSLHIAREEAPSHIRFRLRPPDGVVSAVDSCGRPVWDSDLSSPIARVWQMANGRIHDISLFSSDNIETLSDFGGKYDGNTNVPKFEAPFYFGTVNSEPYIIPSDKMRSDMRKFTTSQEAAALKSRGLDVAYHSRALYIHDVAITNMIGKSYRKTMNAIEADPYGGVSNPQSKRKNNCPMNVAVTVIGSTELQQVGFGNEERGGDLGWFVFKPLDRQHVQMENLWSTWNGLFYEKGRCAAKSDIMRRIKEKFNVDAPVSGWWRIGALTLFPVLISMIAVFYAYITKYRGRKHHSGNRSKTFEGKTRADQLSFSPSPTVSAERRTSSKTQIPERRDSSRRTASTTTSEAPSDPFVSKFLEDFVPEKWLGRGGYGVVFSCRHRLDDHSYAVKRIAVSDTPPAIERVKREAKAMAKLDHPGIIRYFHTWMERPPDGWQQQTDKQILANIRKILNSPDSSVMRSSDDGFCPQSGTSVSRKHPAVKANRRDGLSFLGDKIVGAENGPTWDIGNAASGTTTSGSWVDSGTCAKNQQDSASSDSNSSQEVIGGRSSALDYHQQEESNSSDVIFMNDTRWQESISESDTQKSTTDPLEPPAVLVANETDLQTCKKTKDYVYFYIQMELCQELTLHNWLLTNNRVEDRVLEVMRNWFAQLVCAIDYIHDQGLIHRDLKPQNIFFSADGQGFLKIGDLGLATNFGMNDSTAESDQLVNSRHTGNVGTRLYMSPEQLMGQPYNQKIDVFSLGLIFAEMLIPFETVMERSVTLTKLQDGFLSRNLLKNLAPEREFIMWLTTVDAERRPSCKVVMESEYLSEEMNHLGVQFTRNSSSRSVSFRKRLPKVTA